MMNRAFLSAFAALLLSATLVQTAAALPTTVRSATTTVTGTYRPINLDLALVDSSNVLTYTTDYYAGQEGNPSHIGAHALNGPNPSGLGPRAISTFSFEVLFSGSFTKDDSNARGDAGYWRLILSDGYDGVYSYDNFENTIYLNAAKGAQVGTLTYVNGLVVAVGELPDADTPKNGDVFDLYSIGGGDVLRVDCHDGLDPCSNFDLKQLLSLAHLGPYVVVPDDGDNSTLATAALDLDEPRVNLKCFEGGVETGTPVSCGTVSGLRASSKPSAVPEPATLALIGLGLVGLGLSRRTRA